MHPSHSLLGVSVLMLLALPGCSLVEGLQERQALAKAEFSFERIELVSADVPLLTADPKADFKLVLRVYNPNTITARLDQLTYTALMEGEQVATGTTGDAFAVSPKATNDLTLPLTFHYSQLPASALNAIQKRGATFGLQGTSTMNTPIGSLALPFAVTKQATF